MKKRAPRNTTRDVDESPVGMLLSMYARGTSNAIEHQEAQGQADFVASDTLPTLVHGPIERLIEGGVVLGDVVEGDELFRYVALPDGWKRRPTDHPMWSELVGPEGRVRATVFYKAAFYDRKAHLHVLELP